MLRESRSIFPPKPKKATLFIRSQSAAFRIIYARSTLHGRSKRDGRLAARSSVRPFASMVPPSVRIRPSVRWEQEEETTAENELVREQMEQRWPQATPYMTVL